VVSALSKYLGDSELKIKRNSKLIANAQLHFFANCPDSQLTIILPS